MIELFLNKVRIEGRLLLGLSGGPDSLCLFYQLLDLSIPFSVAHVDHGWRQESGEEAEILSRLCNEYDIEFFLKTLNPKEMKGNLEDACRNARLQFFYEIYQKGYQALVLGHQAGDLAETVLKRLFEGAALTSLASMSQVSNFRDMPVWRPLLNTSKEEILAWLQERGVKAFEDSTNFDEKYLRPRFRQTILPFLAECFGKNIEQPLLAISAEAAELDAYMAERCLPLQIGVFGVFVDLSECHPFEMKYMIRKLARLSREELNAAVSFIAERSGNKWINRKLYIDRGKLFILNECAPFEARPLTIGEFEMGEWRVKFERSSVVPPPTDWKGVWQGEVSVSLPAGEYSLGIGKVEGQVPAIFKSYIPAVLQGGQLFHEFLSGRKSPNGEFLLTLTYLKKTIVA